MTISMDLSPESIRAALGELETVRDNIKTSVKDIVEILAQDGADVANSAYGGMAGASAESVSDTEAKIVVAGGDKAVIAEFGAGYATMEYHPFAGNAPVPIEVGSYSREHGGMFALTDFINPGGGYWIFGWSKGSKGKIGKPNYMDRVPARHGLLDAYDYINVNAGMIASEVFRL